MQQTFLTADKPYAKITYDSYSQWAKIEKNYSKPNVEDKDREGVAYKTLQSIHDILLHDKVVQVEDSSYRAYFGNANNQQIARWKFLGSLAKEILKHYEISLICRTYRSFCNLFKNPQEIVIPPLPPRILALCDKINERIDLKIENFNNPPKAFPLLPDNITTKMVHHMDVDTCSTFSRVNKTANVIAKNVFLLKLKDLNYRGNDYINAGRYLKSIENGGMEILLSSFNYLNREYVILNLNTAKINAEATLKQYAKLKLPREQYLNETPVNILTTASKLERYDVALMIINLVCGWTNTADMMSEGQTERDRSLSNFWDYRRPTKSVWGSNYRDYRCTGSTIYFNN